MPVSTSAKKALRRDRRRTQTNYLVRAQLRNVIAEAKANPSEENLSQAYATIDRAAKKHIIHHNKGARLKSQLSKLLSESSKTKAAVKPKAKAKAKPKTKAKTKSKPKAKAKTKS